MNKEKIAFGLGFISAIVSVFILLILILSSFSPLFEKQSSDSFNSGSFDAEINSPHGVTAMFIFFLILLYSFYISKLLAWKSETFEKYADKFFDGIESASPLMGVIGGCGGGFAGIFALSSFMESVIKACGYLTAWLIPIERSVNMWTLMSIFMCSIFIPLMISILYNAYFREYFNNTFKKNAIEITATILKVSQTGVYINKLPQIKIKFTYNVDGKEYVKSTTMITNFINAANFQAGNSMIIHVNKNNPNRFILG